MKILVTGGAGYIGSHAVVELLNHNYEVVIIDNFSNSNVSCLENIRKITNKDFDFYEGDVSNKDLLIKIFDNHNIEAVIHFAGFKAVGESVSDPLKYYQNNLISTLNLLEVMNKYGCYQLVFSSSATVYGNPEKLPLQEDFPLCTTNPYGTTKLMIEQILQDLSKSQEKWSIVLLRYFNPIGAHESGFIGENPNGIPNNLMPYIMKVAIGKLPELQIFGNDYDTSDGTGVRDYIHVVDLAKGHVKALGYVLNHTGIEAINLGTGKGYSVLEIVKYFEEVNCVKIPYKFAERRSGDIASCYASVEKAKRLLSFQASKSIQDMCRDSYQYVLKNKD